jgi:hypothetical protein
MDLNVRCLNIDVWLFLQLDENRKILAQSTHSPGLDVPDARYDVLNAGACVDKPA